MSELVFDDNNRAYLKGYPYPDEDELRTLRTFAGIADASSDKDVDTTFTVLMQELPPGFSQLEQAGFAVSFSQGITDAVYEKWGLLQERNPRYQALNPDLAHLFNQGVNVVIGSAVAIASKRSPEIPDDITHKSSELLLALREQADATFPVLDQVHPDAVTMNALVADYDPLTTFQDFTTTPHPSLLGVFYAEWLEREHRNLGLVLGGIANEEWSGMQAALTAGMSTGFEFFQAEFEYRN